MTLILQAFAYLYVLALHSSMAAMEIVSWSLFLLITIKLAKDKDWARFRFPIWPLMAALFLTAAISLSLNPHLRSVTFQLGFFRWILLLYGFSWVLTQLWSPQFERKLVTIWLVALAAAGACALFQAFTGIDFVHPHQHWVSNEGAIWRPVGFFSRSLT